MEQNKLETTISFAANGQLLLKIVAHIPILFELVLASLPDDEEKSILQDSINHNIDKLVSIIVHHMITVDVTLK